MVTCYLIVFSFRIAIVKHAFHSAIGEIPWRLGNFHENKLVTMTTEYKMHYFHRNVQP